MTRNSDTMQREKLTELPTPIEYFDTYNSNNVYIKRDDLTDLAFGGNKVRKLEYFLADAKANDADCIVNYGSAQSKHCRLTAAAARKKGFKVVLILAKSNDKNLNGNYLLYELFNANIVWTETNQVRETIEQTMKELESEGYKSYFIQGGGHGNLGTHAYKEAFDEIIKQQSEMNTTFDYIVHASGTGTTQAGLVAGKILSQSTIDIIGFSIARRNPSGKQVVIDSLVDYLRMHKVGTIGVREQVHFDDTYIGQGYADIYPQIIKTIKEVSKQSGILLDPVYTGKAFYGMLQWLENKKIRNKNILFIHTGGSPLLFNYAPLFKENK